MTVTPETLPRHELVGLAVRVTAAANPDLLDVEGEVVTETTKTLGIEREGASPSTGRTGSGDADRIAHVPKEGTTFEFDLSSGQVVTVEGRRLVGRPARRTENTGDSKWR